MPTFLITPLTALCFAIGNPASVIALRELPYAVVAAGRCLIAAAALALLLRGKLLAVIRSIDGRTTLLLTGTGLALAAHFLFWTAGLAHTSFPAAISLVALEPVGVLAFSAVFFGQRPTLAQCAGIAAAVAGGLLISLGHHGETQGTPHHWTGDALVLGGVLVYGFYFAGNRALESCKTAAVRAAGSTSVDLAYATMLYLIAGLACWLADPRLPTASTGAWTGLLVAGIVPTCIGHTLTQIAARRSAPIWVALISPGETLISLILGALYLRSYPSLEELAGAAAILGGAFLSIAGR